MATPTKSQSTTRQSGGKEVPVKERAGLYPSLYQINTRVWLTDLFRTLGRPATLDDIPDVELDRLAKNDQRKQDKANFTT